MTPDRTLERWRLLAAHGDPPKAIDLGIFEQLWGERLDALAHQGAAAGRPLDPALLAAQAGSQLALLRALACVEVEPGCYYFGGPPEEDAEGVVTSRPPSKGHTVTLRRHLSFWYGEERWTEGYLRQVRTPPPAQDDLAEQLKRAPFEEQAWMLLRRFECAGQYGCEVLNALLRQFDERFPRHAYSYAGRLARCRPEERRQAEAILREAEADPERAKGENEGLQAIFFDRWLKPSPFRRS